MSAAVREWEAAVLTQELTSRPDACAGPAIGEVICASKGAGHKR